MSYEKKSFWKRTLAFVLTVLIVITSMPFGMQKVKAADTEFSIKLVYEESDATQKPVDADSAQLVFSKGETQYTFKASKDSTNAGQYKFTVPDNCELLSSDKISFDTLVINIDGYKKAEINNSVEIKKNVVAEFTVEQKKDGATASFDGGDKTISYSDVEGTVYDVSSLLKVEISPEDTAALESKTVKYGISGGNIPASDGTDSTASQAENINKASIDDNGRITGLTASENAYVVTAVISFNEYKDVTADMKLTVNKAEQDTASFEKGENVSDTFDNSKDSHEYVNKVIGIKENANVTYAIDTTSSDADIATVDSTGKVTYSKTGTVKVKATIAETDNYNEKVISYNLVIGKQAVDNFVFSKNTDTVTFGENSNKYSQTVQHSGGNIGNISYSLTDDSGNTTEVAQIDALTGEITIKKAGTVRITAEAAETDTYGSASASYTLIIKKADRTISFENSDSIIEIEYNDNSTFTNKASVNDKTGDVIYSIISGNGQVDETGKVTYLSTGSIKIKAYVAADDYYNECSVEYTLNVKYAAVASYDNYVEIQGKKNNDSGWYAGEITITAKDGYNIRNGIDDIWQTSLVIATDGDYTNYNITVKDGNGVIYNAVSIPEVKIDSKAPEYVGIEYEESLANKVLNAITFGYYKNDVTVTISAKDDMSGVDSLTYTVMENPDTDKANQIKNETIEKDKLTFSQDGKTATYSFKVKNKGKIGVTFNATDVAGHGTSEFSDDKGIIIDNEAPVINYDQSDNYVDKVSPDNTSVESGDDIRYIYNDNADVNISISDENIDTSKVRIQVNKDGSSYETINIADMTKKDDKTYTYECKLSEEGSYEIITYADDYSGNGNGSLCKTWKGVIDKTPPVINITYDDTSSDRKALISIKEKNLRISDVEAVLSAYDSLGNEADVNIKIVNTEVALKNLESVIKDKKYWTQNGDEWTTCITFCEDAVYKDFEVKCSDLAGRAAKLANQQTYIRDVTEPQVSYEMAEANNTVNGVYYYGKNISAIVTINVFEEHFNPDNMVVTDTVASDKITYSELQWKRKQTDDGKETNIWTTTVNVSDKEGINVISVSGSDTYGNPINNPVSSPDIVVDHTDPVISVEYDDTNSKEEGIKYLNVVRKATITITEADFDPSFVETYVTANNYSGDKIDVYDYADYLKNPASWTTRGDIHVAEITFKDDANYTFNIKCRDLAGLESAERTADRFAIDRGAPEDYKIEYSNPVGKKILETITFNKINKLFYGNEAYVTITAKDEISGIQKFIYSVSNEDADNTDNYVVSNKEVYVDVNDTAFRVSKDGTVSYTFKIPAQANGKVSFTAYDYAGNPVNNAVGITDNENNIIVENNNPIASVSYNGNLVDKDNLIYDGSVAVQMKIKEDYFYQEDVEISATKDGSDYSGMTKEWYVTPDADGNYVCNITFNEDGAYTLIINYHDTSGNYVVVNGEETNKDKKYISDVFSIDTKAPVVKVSYDQYNNDNTYVTSRTATIAVTERNFRPDEVELYITAKDNAGDNVEYTIPDLKNQISWRKSDSEADKWLANIVYNADANYEFSISYKDMAGHPAVYNDNKDKYDTDLFTVVKTGPTDIEIVSISSNYKKTWNKILNAVTFGYYSYKTDEITITVQASHKVSPVNGFVWEYNRESGASTSNIETLKGYISADNIKYSDNGMVATASFTISANSINYSQIRGNIKITAYNKAGLSGNYTDNNDVIIIDTIAPERTVTFSPAKQVADSVLYYADTASVRFNVTEANFYPEDVNVSVNDQKRSLSWNKAEGQDLWYADMNISGDGDYVIKMTYIDRSDNVMNEYVSDKIVIDTINPAINVAYTNNNVINNIDGNRIYNSNQTAVITVNEHNFRASDININITAQDINGNIINIPDYSSYLKNSDNWTNAGDVHTAQITFSAEANYSLNIAYTDMAGRTTGDYSTDYFTVDKSDPYDFNISYSSSIIDTVLQAITFGFYNAPVDVTVEVKDDISAISRIEYDYSRDGSASGVNEELIAGAIGNSDLTQSGNTATVQFSIPQNQASQLNGTINLVAYDSAGNNSAYNDDRRVVVDNIAPNATVTYSEPVQSYNGIAYYAGDIQATVTVNEANFYPEDMIINVSSDGNSYPVNTQWSDIDADTHVGTFIISGDGDYYVSISYTDKSQNVMDNYTSDQMTIDTQTPTVSISNIKNNSANKDSRYTFTITANDINFDVSGFTPVLSAVVRDASGNYSVREISLGTVAEVEAGKTYSFTVDNLNEDAVYTLTCVIRDLAGNEYNKILLDDGQEYESVVFSINRNGSTFWVDAPTQTLLNNYYVYEVSSDVVVFETNVDPINNYRIKLNGNELTENSDYTSTMTNNAGEWAIRTYDINRNLFTDEGEYKIVVESIDKTDTSAYSDVKNLNISFVVDKTAPILTVSGLQNGGRYQSTEQEVTVLATDDGGRLNSFKVEVFDSSDQPISGESVRFDKSGDELIQYLSSNDGKVTFTVPEGLSQKVVLTCSDAAVHEDGSTNETVQQFTKITVSPSGMVMFYANKPLFYGIIILAILILAGVTFVIVRKVQKSRAK